MKDSAYPVLSYYGDDFTGSTDVMEAMASNGLSTVLFLGIPEPALLKRFQGCQVIGIAGTSRSESPQWMDDNLRDTFNWLKRLNARFCHYKVCSTFDSSPTIGSIGKAIELGKSVFDQPYVPLVVGAPQLKRYTAFGNLFAAYQGKHYRIDRHPVMSRHPVTPMLESDLRRHLSQQTQLNIDLVDLVCLQAIPHEASQQETIKTIIDDADGVVLFDVADGVTQQLTGEQLCRLNPPAVFVAGSSGVEYALIAHWQRTGEIQQTVEQARLSKEDRIAVVSGSVSPTTERQIGYAAKNGFDNIPINPVSLVGDQAAATIDRAVEKAGTVLANGRCPLVYTALGPGQDKGRELDKLPDARHRIGQALGHILRQIIESHRLKRAVIAGGDTSSHALNELGVDALTLLKPLPSTPGSPLCQCHAQRHGSSLATDGLQIALKGGQVGNDDYFCMIRDLGQEPILG